MEDLEDYQFREERVRKGGGRAIQGLNVTYGNNVGSDESSRTKHFLSVYTDEEKEWLVKTDEEERNANGAQNTPFVTTFQHRTSKIMQ